MTAEHFSPSVLVDGQWVPDDQGIMRWQPDPPPPLPQLVLAAGEVNEAEFRRMWASDATIPELAEMYACSTGTISNWARKLGCPRRRTGRKKAR
jgi:hypothetical protein